MNAILLNSEKNDELIQKSVLVGLRDHSAWNVPGSKIPNVRVLVLMGPR